MPMRTVLGFVAYVADTGTGKPTILKGAQGEVFSVNDVGLTTPLACRDLATEAVIPNPVSNEDGFIPPFKISISDTASGILWVSGEYVIYQPFLGVKGEPGDKGDTGGLDEDDIGRIEAYETRVESIETIGGLAPGDVSDATVASVVANPDSQSRSALQAEFVALRGTRGLVRRVYVRATGDDSYSGKTQERSFREIRAAVESLALDGPVVRGSVVIDVGAGTYKGGIRLPLTRGSSQDDFIKIVGPPVGHPNAPTAVIDKAADPSQTSGITAEDGCAVWVEDIKTLGGFAIGADVRRSVYLWLRNFHADGLGVGGVGVAINSHCRYYVAGGLIENMVTSGIQELFHVTRSFNNVSSNTAQMTIRNCDVGFRAKENCVGHLDYLNIEDCGTGVEMNGFCVVNVKSISLKRNTLGYANINSEIHNEGGIVWGIGPDANTREFFTSGSGTELGVWGWQDASTARTTVVGHRPLITVAGSYADSKLVGPTAETNFYTASAALKGHRYNTAGKSFQVVVRGAVTGPPLAAPYRVLLRVSGIYVIDAVVPAGTETGTSFVATWDTVCHQDGNNQKTFSTMEIGGKPSTMNYSVRTISLGGADSSVRISAISGAAPDEVTLRTFEVWG